MNNHEKARKYGKKLHWILEKNSDFFV